MGTNRRIASIFLAAIIMCFGSFKTIQAAEDDKLKVSHSYGFESVYKWGTLVPITVEVDNNLKNIDGELQIELPVFNPEMGITNNDNVTLYTQNINLPLNTKKKFTLNIPISRNITSVKMNIVEGKNTLLSKDLSLGTALNPEDFIIGTLSDDFNSVSYINKVSIDSSSMGKRNFNTKLVKLDENSISEDANVLKPISVIIINNFDTSKISKAKYETIKKWVDNGGMLLIGTGPSYNKTLSIFKDNFISGDIGNVSSVETKSLYKMLDNNSTSSMKLDALNINIKDSNAVIKEGNLPLVQRIEKGKGVVAVAAFDLGLNPLTNWSLNSTFGEKLVGNNLPDYYNDANAYSRMVNGGGYNISYGLGNIPELPIPKASNLIIIFFIYIVIAAPVNYIILKKKDRRELMWVTVPALSVIFAIVVYFSGSTTRVTKPVANILSTIVIDSKGNQNIQSYGTVVTPKKSDIKIEAKDDMNIRPIVNLDYYDNKQNADNSKGSKTIYSKITTSPKTTMEFYNTGVFGQYNFIVDNNEIRKGALQSEIKFNDNKITGTIKNNTGLDLKDCYIITSSAYVEIGEIKNGETKNISEPIKNYAGNSYQMLDNMFGRQYGGSAIQSTKQIQEKRVKEQKRMLMQSYFDSFGGRVTDPVLTAITDSQVTKDILVNNDAVKKYNKSLVVSNVELSYINGDKAEYPLGSIVPKVSSLSNKLAYDPGYGFIHGDSGEVEIKFQVGDKVKVESFELKQNQSNNPNGPNFQPLTNKGYIFNTVKNAYEECDYNNFTAGQDKASQYVDKDNIIKIKIDTTGLNQPGTIPQISVKGSVK